MCVVETKRNEVIYAVKMITHRKTLDSKYTFKPIFIHFLLHTLNADVVSNE